MVIAVSRAGGGTESGDPGAMCQPVARGRDLRRAAGAGYTRVLCRGGAEVGGNAFRRGRAAEAGLAAIGCDRRRLNAVKCLQLALRGRRTQTAALQWTQECARQTLLLYERHRAGRHWHENRSFLRDSHQGNVLHALLLSEPMKHRTVSPLRLASVLVSKSLPHPASHNILPGSAWSPRTPGRKPIAL